jgi:hypothetical protein
MVGFRGSTQEKLAFEIFRFGYEIASTDKKVPDPVGSEEFLYYRNVPNKFAVVCAMLLLFRRGRIAEFLKARIIPERIEHRIEPQQRRSKRHADQAVVR